MRILLVACLLAGAATAQTGQAERELLTKQLHGDPVALLRAIGTASSHDAAETAGETLRNRLADNDALRLRLLRFGLGADDDAAVFGAAVLSGGDPSMLLLPELRHAAAVIVPRFGAPDCPVEINEVVALEGSCDIPAVIARIPHVPAEIAVHWLDELHRLVRPEYAPALCALALQTTGDVRCAAFLDAWFVADCSGQHVPLVVATWLQLVDGKPDADGDGLPGVLTAAMRWTVEHFRSEPADPQAAPGASRELRNPYIMCRRWLATSRAGVKDLPLLRQLVEGDCRWFTAAALRTLGDLHDAESAALLLRFLAEDDVEFQLAARTALAARGDAGAKAQLLAGDTQGLACWFAIATPNERAEFCRRLLAAPVPDAMALLHRIGELQYERQPTSVPIFDVSWLDGLEPLAADTALDARVLRTLVAVVPACATKRLAGKLLSHPATELFATATRPGTDGVYWAWTTPNWLVGSQLFLRGGVGFDGVWPFLEVTAPAAFRARLREGLALADPAIRDQCGDLLLRLHDAESAAGLVAWVETAPDCLRGADAWLLLARCGGGSVKTALLARLRDESGKDVWERDAARALAVLLGMPFELAPDFDCEPAQEAAVLTALRQGDAGGAFLATGALHADGEARVDVWLRAEAWREPRIQALVQPQLERDAERSAMLAARLGIQRADPAAFATIRELMHDGRYELHHVWDELLTLGRDVATLPFWIDEYGTNCCRRCVAEEALSMLFRGNYHGADEENEPMGVSLRRQLLPLRDRLRWSELSHAYVVAGR